MNPALFGAMIGKLLLGLVAAILIILVGKRDRNRKSAIYLVAAIVGCGIPWLGTDSYSAGASTYADIIILSCLLWSFHRDSPASGWRRIFSVFLILSLLLPIFGKDSADQIFLCLPAILLLLGRFISIWIWRGFKSSRPA